MNKILIVFLAVFSLLFSSHVAADTGVQDLGSPGTKTRVGNNMTLAYEFSAHPAMGTLILKVKVTDAEGKPVEGLSLTGVSDMPEMRDSNSGKVKFVQNKKKDFLLPINITMPGKWQVIVIVKGQKKILLTGKIDFNV